MPRATMNEEQKKEFGKFHEYYAEMLAPKIFITVREYAEANGTSIQDVRSMLLAGEMPGAYLVGDTVRIPVNGMVVDEAKERILALGKDDFSIYEVGQMLSVSYRTVYRWIKNGDVSVKKGRGEAKAPRIKAKALMKIIRKYNLPPYYRRDERCKVKKRGV